MNISFFKLFSSTNQNVLPTYWYGFSMFFFSKKWFYIRHIRIWDSGAYSDNVRWMQFLTDVLLDNSGIEWMVQHVKRYGVEDLYWFENFFHIQHKGMQVSNLLQTKTYKMMWIKQISNNIIRDYTFIRMYTGHMPDKRLFKCKCIRT